MCWIYKLFLIKEDNRYTLTYLCQYLKRRTDTTRIKELVVGRCDISNLRALVLLEKNVRQDYQIKLQLLEKSKILIKGVKRQCMSWKLYLLEEQTYATEHCRIQYLCGIGSGEHKMPHCVIFCNNVWPHGYRKLEGWFLELLWNAKEKGRGRKQWKKMLITQTDLVKFRLEKTPWQITRVPEKINCKNKQKR